MVFSAYNINSEDIKLLKSLHCEKMRFSLIAELYWSINSFIESSGNYVISLGLLEAGGMSHWYLFSPFFQSNIKYNLPINHSALTCWKLHYNEKRDIWDHGLSIMIRILQLLPRPPPNTNNLEPSEIKYIIPTYYMVMIKS